MADIVEKLRAIEIHAVRASFITFGPEPLKSANAVVQEAADEIERLRGALEWYGEQARLARLIHSEGDIGRHALAADGGKRARAVLPQPPEDV